MVGQLSRITGVRGWLLIVVIALAAYLALGIPGVIAWIAGAVSGLSVSDPWEAEDEDTAGPWGGDRSGGSAYRHQDARLRFTALDYPRNTMPCTAHT